MDIDGMSDNEIIKETWRILHGLHEKDEKMQVAARIATLFMEKFKPTLLEHIEKHKGDVSIYFKRDAIISDECDYDMRRNMDNETINEITKQGYLYDKQNSTNRELVFNKV